MEKLERQCTACQGKQIPVDVIAAGAGVSNDWKVARAGRTIQDHLTGRYSSEVRTYVCTSCGQITFYAVNLKKLLDG